jgi:hypothetical protein
LPALLLASVSDGKTMMFYALIALFLLGVDWLEDPHFGQSAFSRPMASQIYGSDELEQHVMVVVEHPQFIEQQSLATTYCIPTIEPMAITVSPFSIPALYNFMSIQR